MQKVFLHLIFILGWSSLLVIISFANVTTSTGSVEFDVDNDGSVDLTLNQTGLSVGGAHSPSSNLDVAGNALISGTITIGGVNSSSTNLFVHGTYAMGSQIATDNVTLGANTVIVADSSSGDITLTLPGANVYQGVLYSIKKISPSNAVSIFSSSNIDNLNQVDLSSGNQGYVHLTSNGSQWWILDQSSDASLISAILGPSPQISLLLAADETSTAGVNSGDNIYITFDGVTNIPEVSSKLLVDNLIDFGSKVLGANYEGYWNLTGNTLTITVLDATGSTLVVGDDISIKSSGSLKFQGDVGPASTASETLSGNFGGFIGGGPPPNATTGYDIYLDASLDTNDDGTWDDQEGFWNPPESGTVSWLSNAGSSLPGITSAFDLGGGGTTTSGFSNGDGFTNWGMNTGSISMEIWFKPDSASTTETNGHILFETGGGTGFGIFYNDGTVVSSHDSNQNAISYDVTSLIGEYIQVLVTYKIVGSTDDFKLYINGVERDSNNYDDNNLSGSDGAGLGRKGDSNVGGKGSGDQNTGAFDGKIAIFRLYFGQVLTADEVLDNYNSVATAGSAEIDNSRNYPLINSITAADAAYDVGIGNSDNLTFVFSGNTNTPAVGTKADIDNLISFHGGNTLGGDYAGVWNADGNILVITITDKTGATVTAGQGANLLAAGAPKFASTPGNGSTASGTIGGTFDGDVFWDIDEVISSAELWFDASDSSTITLNGSDVSQINDKSGKGRNVSESAGNQPGTGTWSNGLATIYWDPNDHLNDRLRVTGLSPAFPDGDRHHFAAISPRKSEDNAFGGYLLGTNAPGGEERVVAAGRNSDDPSLSYSPNFSNSPNTDPVEQLVSWEVDEGVRIRIFKNGSVFSTDTTTTDVDLSATILCLGGRQGGNDNFAGHLGEFMTLSDISEATRIRVEGYLAHKWNLEGSLPDDHLYKNHAPRVTPIMISLVANDFDESSHLVDVNDTITAVFDGITNTPAVGTKADVDALLDFGSNVLGADYSGAWNGTGNVLTLTILDASGSTAGVGMDISIKASGNLFYSGNTIPSSHTATVTGDFGLDISLDWNPGRTTSALWFDARDVDSILVGSSDNVYQWNDKSGNSRHMTQSTSTAQPTSGNVTLNTYNLVHFDGSTDFMDSVTGPAFGSVNAMVFSVINSNNSNRYLHVLHGRSGGSIAMDLRAGVFQYNTLGNNLPVPAGTNQPVIASGFRDGSTQAVGHNATYTSDTNGADIGALDTWMIGARPGPTNLHEGTMAEIVAFESYDIVQQTKMEGYLAHKWGLEANLPTDHWYRYQRPMIYPVVISAVANDPTNMTIGPGTGDNLVLTFDGATNTPAVGTKSDIDAIFSFGDNTLGTDYSGAWNVDGNILTITINNGFSANLAVGQTLTILSGGNLTYSGNSTPSEATQPIVGDFGNSLSSNLFLWWTLDETSGNTANDGTVNNRDGDLTNELYFAGNTIGAPHDTGLRMSKVNDTVTTLQSSISSGGYTWALWANYNWSTNGSIPTDPEVMGSSGYIWASSNLKFHKSAFHKLSNGTYVSTPVSDNLLANTWYHLAGTYDGSNLRVYLNGVIQSSNTATSWAGAANVILANPLTHAVSKPNTDEVRVFNRALSDTEVLALYHAGNPLALWTPAEITTIGWYDASDNTTITADGSKLVSEWRDLSGSGCTLSQSTSGDRPRTEQSTLNGLNIIDGDGGEYVTGSFTTPSSGDVSVHVVARIYGDSPSGAEAIFTLTGGTGNPILQADSSSQWNGEISDQANGALTLTTGPFDNETNLFGMVYKFSDNSRSVYVNGSLDTSDTNYTTQVTSNTFRFLANRNTFEKVNGGIAEAVIIESPDEDTRQKIEGYLAWKWGLEADLPSGHPYKSTPPTKD